MADIHSIVGGSLRSELLNKLTPGNFRDWYTQRNHRQNIEEGKPHFNGPSAVPDPTHHRPSKLLQCHRKVTYDQLNAPEETSDPDGIFWVGTLFEEHIAFPFLRSVASNSDTYVRNTDWLDFQVETRAGELHFTGSTDPVIVDEESNPIVPTEIKTKSSIDHVSKSSRIHRAQLHAYMVGLSAKYDVELTKGVIIYGCRKSLEVKIFHVEFDEAFWHDVVLEWATNHTEYRLEERLPPPNPEYGWECNYCSFRERCGRGSRPISDSPSEGLLPNFTGYPREKLLDYLDANEDARLTPSLAHAYPSLVDEYGAFDWLCERCETSHPWDTVSPGKPTQTPPRCPDCSEKGRVSSLRGPSPLEQSRGGYQ
ncbi:Dna2/Cas4 domain-containing protein [Haloferax sp. MBLA0076]|uniref:Dna2/Cas4 domain-containing protein n=1 Tax=Haloferax litoreum TaxID=2666140 RepID=A0A6A8GCB5_9EURY|nr:MULTISPECIES: PD-(D/E)XK nuclease family protein [Haloferax]KAB1192427.1 Dna2/Cas4 domain-containing protein [Haloferax sp. CBA1148]MRX20894.1 Dna2/Cas4 domain-containing protein [Haloferax litoreum]